MQFAQHPFVSSGVPAAARGKVIALRPSPRPGAGAAAALGAGRAEAAGRPGRATAPRPLRLIVNRGADGSCRLVASGRLADVCAELNRLSLA